MQDGLKLNKNYKELYTTIKNYVNMLKIMLMINLQDLVAMLLMTL